MARWVSMSESLAKSLVDLRSKAIDHGLRHEFRSAWRKIWEALNTRPLPPTDLPDTFGELRYTTPHSPRHRVCIGAVRPLSIRFSIFEETDSDSGELRTIVTIISVDPMWE